MDRPIPGAPISVTVNRVFACRRYKPAAEDGKEEEELKYVAEHEVFRALADLRERIRDMDAETKSRELEYVRGLTRTIPEAWRSGRLLSQFGEVFGGLGAFPEAIECYQEALDRLGRNDDVPLRAVERLANFQSRYADKLRKKIKARRDAHESVAANDPMETERSTLIAASEQWLQWLLTAGRTRERLALLGSSYKKKALDATDPDEITAFLRQAAAYYGEAHEREVGVRKDKFDPYYALNRLACDALVGEVENPQQADDLIEQCIQAAELREKEKPDFFNRVTRPDAELLRALIYKDLNQEQVERIKNMYAAVFEQRAGESEKASTLDQIDLWIELLARQESPLAAPLRDLRSALNN